MPSRLRKHGSLPTTLRFAISLTGGLYNLDLLEELEETAQGVLLASDGLGAEPLGVKPMQIFAQIAVINQAKVQSQDEN